MIPNIHQSIDEIIKAASPAEKILWQQLRLITGENASVRQLFFEGIYAGTEFLTYNAHKLYLAHEIIFGGGLFVQAVAPFITYRNAADAIFYHNSNHTTYWNGAAPIYDTLPVIDKNIFFGRIELVGFTSGRFCGYRIAY